MPVYNPNLNALDAAVPAQDAVANVDFVDVIGNKTDTVAGTSLYAYLRRVLEGPGAIYAVTGGAAGVAVAGGAGAWANPVNWVEINAGAGVTADSRIVGVALDTPSAAGIICEVDIGLGAGNPAAAVVTVGMEFATDAGGYPTIFFPPVGHVAAGTRIASRIRTAAGGAQTVGVKVLLQVLGA